MAIGQAPIWGQCGGIGFTGPTTCATGSACYYENRYFSNCFPTAASSTEGSNTAAKSLGGKLYFGTAVDNYELNDPAYAEKLNNNFLFGQITPGSLKWDSTEAVQGFFTFEEGDTMVALAQQNGQFVRGPSCISYDELPNWVNAADITSGALLDILVKHCSALISHYAGKIEISLVYPWTDTGFTRPVGFSPSAGLDPTYIDTVLSAARAADPSTKLYISSSGIDTPGPVLNDTIREVQWLQTHGIPIDGVGFRSHFAVGSVPAHADLVANYEAFTALGVEVAITALDISMGATPTGADVEQQQADYQTIIAACKAVAGCVGVTLSDFTDRVRPIADFDIKSEQWLTIPLPGQYSSVPVDYPGSGNALPWDYNLNAKLAYDGIIAGFTN
ncbi:endo-1,4-beta-xylanase A precursor [Mycena galericulata]|nr:endo-1,4-beta-xylanase A precursor [Mycena galericulata]